MCRSRSSPVPSILPATSGHSMSTRKMLMIEAGIVRTYFQLASYFKCMKKLITSIAFMQLTAIMIVQPISLTCH